MTMWKPGFEEKFIVLFLQISEGDVIDVLESILYSPHSSPVTRDYALNALMKLSTRFSAASLE